MFTLEPYLLLLELTAGVLLIVIARRGVWQLLRRSDS
jgi:hypothetical protein